MKISKILAVIGLVALMFAGPVACNKTTLSPTGVYHGDTILYGAEKTITTAYKSFDSFLKWELEYRAVLPVEVSRAADTIRLNAKKWIDSAGALRDAYAANPTAQNLDKLKLSLDLIDAALLESAKYIVANKSKAPLK